MSAPALPLRCILSAGLIGIALSGWAQGPVRQGDESGESSTTRLETLRNAMIDQALDSPVRITSNAWLDESGRLRHVSRFFTEVRARAAADLIVTSESVAEAKATAAHAAPTAAQPEQSGVPTQAVAESASAQPQAVVSRPAEGPDCRLERSGLLRSAIVRMDLVPGDGARGHSVLSDLQQVIQSLMARESGRGGLVIAGADTSSADGYARLISATGQQDSPYRIVVRISSDRLVAEPQTLGALPGQSFLGLSAAAARRTVSELVQPVGIVMPARRVDLDLSLVEVSGDRVLLRHRVPVAVPGSAPTHNTIALQDSTLAEVRMAVLTWWSEAVSLLRCEPILVQANPVGSGVLSIPVGGRTGIRVGDRWMIADRAKIPERVLEQGSIDRIMMAEVVAVGHHRSTLRLTADSASSSVRPGLERGVPWFASPL
jgi:hypothetical protein